MKLKKYFNSFWKAIKGNLFGLNYPLAVEIALTYRCNSRCMYCDFWKHKCEEMSTKQILSLIDEIADDCVYINLIGGEPLLRKDIKQIIDYINEKDGILVSLFTNGSLVPDRIKDLKNLDILVLSLDGPEEINDKLRGEGSFKKIIKAIEAARREGITVWVSTVISKYNINHLDYIIKLGEEMGFSVYFDAISHQPMSSDKVDMLKPPEKEVRELAKKWIKEKKIRPVNDSKPYLQYLSNYPLHKKNFKCTAGRLHFRIEPNGDVYSCYFKMKETKPINGLKYGFMNSMKKLNPVKCDGCWGCAYVELNYMTRFNVSAIKNALNVIKK